MRLRLGSRNQSGVVMLTVLIMLVLITIFTIAMIRLTNSGFLVVGNMQAQQAAENAIDERIEEIITNFSAVTDSTGEWPAGTNSVEKTINNIKVVVARPTCFFTEKSPGYSELDPIAPEDTHWEIVATGSDSLTGAQMEIHQGIKFRALAGACP